MGQQGTKKRSDLTPEEIAEQASKPDLDQIFRETRRNEARDVAGDPDPDDTPHGREERKHQVEEEAEKQ